MIIELTEAEARELRAALDQHLDEEEREVARTDNPGFRRELIADFDALAEVRRKVIRALEQESSSGLRAPAEEAYVPVE